MSNGREEYDIEETLDIANAVLNHLNLAKEKLGSARNWGIFDILGGGFLTTAFKHSRIQEAQSELVKAQRYMDQLRQRLLYFNHIPDLDIDMNDFMVVMDYIFDNPITDIFVQSRISDLRTKVDEAIDQINRIIEDIYAGEIDAYED